MNHYTVTIEDYDTGLRGRTVAHMFQDEYGISHENVSVTEMDTSAYRITIDEVTSGLTQTTIEHMYNSQFPNCTVSVKSQ